MRMMLVLDWSRSTLGEIGSKFLSGEDVDPPQGVTMLARWHDLTSKMAWVVCETNDAAKIQSWSAAWSDYADWETHTILDDEEAGQVISGLIK